MPETSYTAKTSRKIPSSSFDEPEDEIDDDVPAFLKNRRI
jgi:cell division protein FtsZ